MNVLCLSVFERVCPDVSFAVGYVRLGGTLDLAGFERSSQGYVRVWSSMTPIIDDATVLLNLHQVVHLRSSSRQCPHIRVCSVERFFFGTVVTRVEDAGFRNYGYAPESDVPVVEYFHHVSVRIVLPSSDFTVRGFCPSFDSCHFVVILGGVPSCRLVLL